MFQRTAGTSADWWRNEKSKASALVVVSAVSGVTNALVALTRWHIAQRRDQAALETHRTFAQELELDPDAVIGDLIAQLHALIDDPRAAVSALDWQADVLALGGFFQRLGSAYLSANGLTCAGAMRAFAGAGAANQSDQPRGCRSLPLAARGRVSWCLLRRATR